jgi:peptide/nickel transport system permease protein
MKHLIQQAFRSGKFVVGFSVFTFIVLLVIIYPLIFRNPPLEIIGQGTFFPPGIYVNVYDSIGSPTYTLNLDEAATARIASKLSEEDRLAIKKWLVAAGIAESDIDTTNTEKLLTLWVENYDPNENVPGMTNADRNYFIRLNNSLKGILSTEGAIIAAKNAKTDTLEESSSVEQTDYVNVNEVPNVRVLLLGTDNFGRDVTSELVSAIGTSLLIGLVAGLIATSIGLVLGLLAGYVGGVVDDFIMFITNIFTVIPTFVLLILISYSIGQDQRGPYTIAIVIGFTSWFWTARAVRSQVFSLRNRDHVNLSKLSGHPLPRIIFTDILPYIASYVFMALILQITAAVLTEAGLSILGLGPRTTEVPTLGLMMNWAMIYQAHILGKWWAYFPVIVAIALISFSLNLMNTGLDQVYNPTLRE